MLRPAISNSPTRRRARRTSPRPPALLVGPSRLLRGDGIGDPRLKGRALSITLMWVARQNNRLRDTQAQIDRTPAIYLEGLFPDRISNIVRRSLTMMTASSDQTTYPAFTSRIQQAFLSCRLSAQHILLVCVLQKKTGANWMFRSKSTLRLAAAADRAAMAMGRSGGFGRAPDRRYFVRYRGVGRFR
jgi:hypothetical protein